MARAVWKGPYIDPSLMKKLNRTSQDSSLDLATTIINTFSRRSVITPVMVNRTIGVHNGRKFIPVFITLDMVGDKLGAYAQTRTFRGHAGGSRGFAGDKKVKKN